MSDWVLISAAVALGSGFQAGPVTTDPLGREVSVFDGPDVSCTVRRGYAGELDEVEVRDLHTRRRLRVDRFRPGARERETYDPADGHELRTERWWQSQGDVLRESGGLDAAGIPWTSTERARANSEILAYSACVEGMTPSPVNLKALPAGLKNIFRDDAQSGMPRVHLDGCGYLKRAALEKGVKDTLVKGISCLMDPGEFGGGSARGQADAGLLLALLSDPARPFTLRCSNGTIPTETEFTSGIASHCPSESPSDTHEATPPFPGVTVNTKRAELDGEFGVTFLHEALHTLGYEHGRSPEIPYTCSTCCLGPSLRYAISKAEKDKITRRLCAICKQPDLPTSPPETAVELYDLAEYAGIDGRNAMANALAYAKRNVASGGRDDAFSAGAEAFVKSCQPATIAGCSPDKRRVISYLLSAQLKLARDFGKGPRTFMGAPLDAAEQESANGLTEVSTLTRSLFTSVVAATLAGKSAADAVAYANQGTRPLCAGMTDRTAPGYAVKNAYDLLTYAGIGLTQPLRPQDFCGSGS